MDRGGARATALPRLHVVTHDATLSRERWASDAAAVLEAGGSEIALHLRGPRTDGATLYRLASELLPRARRSEGLLFVNDRVDIGLALAVDGVHVGRRSLPVREARRLLRPGTWLGASCRAADGAAAAGSEGADYVFLGTIFETPTHPGVPCLGLERLGEAVRGSGGLTVLGIGGIDPDDVSAVLSARAHGVAVVRGVWDAPDPSLAVGRYLEAIEKWREAG